MQRHSTSRIGLVVSFLLILLVAPLALASSKAEAKKDIVDTAVAAGSFKTLATALQAAGLIDTLKGAGPFTVFAPTDAAFAKLPAGTVEALLKDKQKLTQILTYHVVAGQKAAAEVVASKQLTSLQGKSLAIDTTQGAKIAGANITATDIFASNGVIHVIDTVLIP